MVGQKALSIVSIPSPDAHTHCDILVSSIAVGAVAPRMTDLLQLAVRCWARSLTKHSE